MFHYATGETVEVGDVVHFQYADGPICHVVASIFAPMTTKAKDFRCLETGGIYLADSAKATAGLLLTPPDGDHWDDLTFIKRGST